MMTLIQITYSIGETRNWIFQKRTWEEEGPCLPPLLSVSVPGCVHDDLDGRLGVVGAAGQPAILCVGLRAISCVCVYAIFGME
jgi:hypothetical protein